MFSQNDEERQILRYFGSYQGKFLDIGAFDGKKLSNTWALGLRGWKGVCIEPSPMVYPLLQKNYKGNNKVQCVNFAIGQHTGMAEFYDNNNAVATLVKQETIRWGKGQRFNQITVPVFTFDDFYKDYPGPYDLISLDAEGMDFEILKQIDLQNVGCKMLVVEWNSREKQKYVQYALQYGMKLKTQNGENLIFTR